MPLPAAPYPISTGYPRPSSYTVARATWFFGELEGMPARPISSVMSTPTTIAPPETGRGHPDRHEEIEAIFLSLADQAQDAGWGEAEVSAALVDLADNHLLAIEANGDLADLLKRLRK